MFIFALYFALFGRIIRDTFKWLPPHNLGTYFLLWASVVVCVLLFILLIIKYCLYLKPNRVSDDTVIGSSQVLSNAYSLHSGLAILENLVMVLSTIVIEYYVVYLIALNNDEIQSNHSLLGGMLEMGYFLPLCTYIVFKRISIHSLLILFTVMFVVITTMTVFHHLQNSLLNLSIIYAMSMFISWEYHRQCWNSFNTSNQFQDQLTQTMKVADALKAKELKQMIGNVAHDLKTPLSSFISGIDIIRSILHDLQVYIETHQLTVPDSCCLALERIKEKTSNMLEIVENITNANVFMIMTINRCIDYNKTLFGINLVAKLENTILRDCIQFVLNCVRSVITNDCRIDCIYLDEELIEGDVVLRTDKQWLIENFLCLLSNAVKYSRQGGLIRILIDTIDSSEVETDKESRKIIDDAASWTGSVPNASSRRPSRTNYDGNIQAVLLRKDSFRHKHLGSISVKNGSLMSAPSEDGSVSSISNTRVLTNCQMIRFMVVDSGPGIAPQFLHDLFKEPSQTARLTGGTGLGLHSLAKRVETLHGFCGVSNLFDQNIDPRIAIAGNRSIPTESGSHSPAGCVIWFTLPWRTSNHDNSLDDKLMTDKSQSLSPYNIRHHGDSRISLVALNSPPMDNDSDDVESLHPKIQDNGHQASFNAIVSTAPHLMNTPKDLMGSDNVDITKQCIDSPNISVPSSPTHANTAAYTKLLSMFPRALVVDDSPPILKMTAMSFQKQSYTVATAENGLIATELCRNNSFDVILMDFQMPVMDGIEAMKAIREYEQTLWQIHPLTDSMVIIGFSAKSDDEQIEAAYQNGMDYFLPKPFLIQSFQEQLMNEYMKRSNADST